VAKHKFKGFPQQNRNHIQFRRSNPMKDKKNSTIQKPDKLEVVDALVLKIAYLQKENADLKAQLVDTQKKLAEKELQAHITALGSKYSLNLEKDKIDLNSGVITRVGSGGETPLALSNSSEEDVADDDIDA